MPVPVTLYGCKQNAPSFPQLSVKVKSNEKYHVNQSDLVITFRTCVINSIFPAYKMNPPTNIIYTGYIFYQFSHVSHKFGLSISSLPVIFNCLWSGLFSLVKLTPGLSASPELFVFIFRISFLRFAIQCICAVFGPIYFFSFRTILALAFLLYALKILPHIAEMHISRHVFHFSCMQLLSPANCILLNFTDFF